MTLKTEKYSPAARMLIVNADDFGLSKRTNEGILAAHAQGIVTSTSVLVRYSACVDAVRAHAAHPWLSFGLHLDLGEWFYADGQWRERYRVVALDDASGLRREVLCQLDRFRNLLGEDPSHVDSHQHVHLEEPLRSVVTEIFSALGIQIRHFNPGVRFEGRFYGQDRRGEPLPEAIRPASLLNLIAELPPGVSELGCHPGLDEGLQSTYLLERLVEVQTLCDPEVSSALMREDIRLGSFRDAQETFARVAIRGACPTTKVPSTTETVR